jgi:hypothetical protein
VLGQFPQGSLVTDVTRNDQLAAQTAQHAQRHGLAAPRNLGASLGRGGALAWSIAQTAAAVS